MSRGKGRPFKKGKSGNPNGRPQLPPDIKQARELKRVELERLINVFLFMTEEQITEKLKSKDKTVLEALIGSIILSGISNGDHVRFNWVIEQLCGKLPNKQIVAGATLEELVAGSWEQHND